MPAASQRLLLVVKNLALGLLGAWMQILALPLPSTVTLVNIFNFFESSFLLLNRGNYTYLVGFLIK